MRENLKKPPIIEAVVEIRYKLEKNSVDKIKDAFAKAFSVSFSDMKSQSISFNPAKGEFAIPTPEFFGWEARNNTDVIQIKVDGIVLARIKDYSSFDDFKPYLDFFYKCDDIENVSRVGTRYINRFNIALEKLNKSLLNLTIFNGDTSSNKQLFKREVFKKDALDVVLMNDIIYLENAKAGVTLDVDVSLMKNIKRNEIASSIETIRNLKNDIFYTYINDFMEEFN